jgi:hypothetical protein
VTCKIFYKCADPNIIRGVFNEFTRLIIAVAQDTKLNPNKTTTKELILFMEQRNLDNKFSSFADGLVLRKAIEVNLNDVYKIIGTQN